MNEVHISLVKSDKASLPLKKQNLKTKKFVARHSNKVPSLSFENKEPIKRSNTSMNTIGNRLGQLLNTKQNVTRNNKSQAGEMSSYLSVGGCSVDNQSLKS